MTHADATRHPGREPSDCTGRLLVLESHPDHHIGRAGPADRLISVCECAACGARLSLARVWDRQVQAVGLAYEVLNVYHAQPRALVAELAKTLALPRPRRDG